MPLVADHRGNPIDTINKDQPLSEALHEALAHTIRHLALDSRAQALNINQTRALETALAIIADLPAHEEALRRLEQGAEANAGDRPRLAALVKLQKAREGQGL